MPTRIDKFHQRRSIQIMLSLINLNQIIFSLQWNNQQVGDHNMLILDIIKNKIIASNKSSHKVVRINDLIYDILNNTDMSNINSYEELNSLISSIIDKNTHHTSGRPPRIKKPYINNNILRAIRKKEILYKFKKMFPISEIIAEEFRLSKIKLPI